jgi:DNA-binding protein Fis
VQAHAAQLLGIKKNVMQYKMKKYPPETLHDKDYLSLDVDRYIPPHLGLNEALDAVEKQMILRALDRAGNVQSHAADLLGVNKKVMGYKMKKYGLA